MTARIPDDAPLDWKPEPRLAAAAPAPVRRAGRTGRRRRGLAERVAALEAEVAALRHRARRAPRLASVGNLRPWMRSSCSTTRRAASPVARSRSCAERGIDADVVEYLKAPPDRATLERIVDAIPNPPGELVRKDKRFKELGLDAADYTTRDAVVDAPARAPGAHGATGRVPRRRAP